MRLLTEKGELTLPTDFSFEMEKNSAFFSKDGAATVSATIPATPLDRARLGYPTRIARKALFKNTFPAMLQHGIYQKKGTFVIADADENSITCSMAIDDSELYTNHKDKNVKDIFANKVLTTYSTPLEWSTWLLKVYTGEVSYSDFRLCPVAVNFNSENNSYQVNNEPDQSGSGLWSLKHESRSIVEGDTSVTVPEGYGLAPFLTLSAFLSNLFTLLGYTVGTNCFATDSFLQHIILLHNCSDVACNGRIDYSDLVPNKKVSEILEWLEAKFHATISVNADKKIVNILLMETILNSAYDHELTAECIGYPKYTFQEIKRITITPDTSLEGAAPALPTLQEVKEIYGGYYEKNETEYPLSTPGTVVLRKATGELYKVSQTYRRIKTFKRLGTNYFTYDRKNAVLEEKISPEDLMPPMVFVAGVLMPYIGNRTHRNTQINNSKKDTGQEIIIATYCGLSYSGQYMFATTQKYDDHGDAIVNRKTLNAEEFYFAYWKKYAQMLLNSSTCVTGNFDLKIQDILHYNLYALKQFNGQTLLPSYIKYEIGHRIRCIEAQFFLIKQYSDGQEDQPINPSPLGLTWRFNDSQLLAIEASLNVGVPARNTRYWQWSENDSFEQERYPALDLPQATRVGQQSYHITRYIDIYQRNTGTNVVGTFIETKTFEQWYDAVSQ